MKIGELGKQTGVSTKTIRYYEGIGLLPEPGRSQSGYRSYDEDALKRLRFIKAAQSVGLSLGEVREVLALRDQGRPACAHVTMLIERHAEEITQRIHSLEQMRQDLTRLAKRARKMGSQGLGDEAYCHIIESGPRSRSEAG